MNPTMNSFFHSPVDKHLDCSYSWGYFMSFSYRHTYFVCICMYFCILYDIHIFVWLCFHSFGHNIPRSGIDGSYSKPVCSFKTVSHYVVATDLKLTALLQSLKCWDYKYVPLCPTLYLGFFFFEKSSNWFSTVTMLLHISARSLQFFRY